MKQVINWIKFDGTFEDVSEMDYRKVYAKWEDGDITTENLCHNSYYNEKGEKVYNRYLSCNPLKPEYYAEIK